MQFSATQTILFCIFCSYKLHKKEAPEVFAPGAWRLEFAELGFTDLLDLVVGAPAVENHADSIVLDRLTFTGTEFDKIGSAKLSG